MLKYRNKKDELKNYMEQNRAYFGNIDIETYQALREFLHSEKMLKDITGLQKEVRIDMCQALEELYSEGIEEGREEGRIQGQKEGITTVVVNMLKNGLSAADIKKYAGVSDQEIKEAQELLNE